MTPEDVGERLAALNERVGSLREQIKAIREENQACLVKVDELRRQIDDDRERQRIERRADWKWRVGVALTCAALIVSALAIFAHSL